MKFVANGVKYELDEEKVTFAEARAMQKVAAMTLTELGKAASAGDSNAVQAFVWVAMKRQDSTLKFTDIDDMAIGEIEFIPEDETADPDAADSADPTQLDAEQDGTSTPSG